MNRKDQEKYDEALNQIKVRCTCGHRQILPAFRNKTLCSWCHHFIYRNKKEEFKDKLEIALRKVNKNE